MVLLTDTNALPHASVAFHVSVNTPQVPSPVITDVAEPEIKQSPLALLL
jgi:hypothetical protein